MNFLNRILEPSTWAGVAAMGFGIPEFFQTDQAAEIGRTVSDAGLQAAKGNYWMAGFLAVSGLLSILLPERDRRR